MSFVWCFALIAVFAPLAVARYRNVAAKIGQGRFTQRTGSSVSLPEVRRAWRSSWARRTSESG